MHPNSTHLPVPPYPPLTLAVSPPQKQKPSSLLFLSHGSNISSFLLSNQLCQQMFIAGSHCSGPRPLVSGTPSSLDSPRNSLGISRGHPESWRCCGYSFTRPVPSQVQQVLGGVDVRVGHPKTWLWAWVAAELVRPSHGAACLRRGDRASSPMPMPPRSVLLCL